MVMFVRQQDDRPRMKTRFDMLVADPEHLLPHQHAGQLAREFIQRAGARFPVSRHARLVAQPRCKVADDQRNREHDAEHDQVLRVGNRQRETRRHEEIVEGRDVQESRQDRRAASESHGHQRHREQEQHHDVGGVEVGSERHRADGCQRANRDGPGVRDVAQGRLFTFRENPGAALRRGRIEPDLNDLDIRSNRSQPLHEGLCKRPAVTAATADHHAREVVAARIVNNLLRRRLPGQRGGLGAELLRQRQHAQDAFALRIRQLLQLRRLDIHGMPLDAELFGEPGGAAHQFLGAGTGADAGHQRFARGPDRTDGLVVAVDQHLVVDAVRRPAQRQFAQRDEIAFAEEILDRALRLRRHVNLALAQPQQQLVGRQVHDGHFIGMVEDAVRNGFPDLDAGDAGDHVVQAFQVLDVDRGIDADAGIEQFLDVLPALRMTGTGRVVVRQLIDQDDGRVARERRVEIEFRQVRTAMFDIARPQDFEAFEQCRRVLAPVGFRDADDDVYRLRTQFVRGRQHRVGFADPPPMRRKKSSAGRGWRGLPRGGFSRAARRGLGGFRSLHLALLPIVESGYRMR